MPGGGAGVDGADDVDVTTGLGDSAALDDVRC